MNLHLRNAFYQIGTDFNNFVIDFQKFTPRICVLSNLSALVNDIHLFHTSDVNLTYISNPLNVIFAENRDLPMF